MDSRNAFPAPAETNMYGPEWVKFSVFFVAKNVVIKDPGQMDSRLAWHAYKNMVESPFVNPDPKDF
jgi:hypothetical protein